MRTDRPARTVARELHRHILTPYEALYSEAWGEQQRELRHDREKERLGERIRRLRTEHKLGLRETALKIGISPTYLSRIETLDEKTPPAEDVIRKLADLLQDEFDELMQLAGRVPDDALKVVKADSTMPEFLRTVGERKLTGEKLMEMLDAKKKGKSQRVARGGGVRAEEAGRVPIEETIAAIIEITSDRTK